MTSNPPLKCCEKCIAPHPYGGNLCKYVDCPCHTPPVEGEWAERFDREFVDPQKGDVYRSSATSLKLFITTLLHSERESAYEEGQKNAFGVDRERVKEEGRAEERERIVKMCEEISNEYKTRKRMTPFQDTLFNHAVNVLEDLRNNLTNNV